MHLSIAHCTETGGRDSNQDFVGFCANEKIGCFTLADGTGGYEGGEMAARAVVGEVLQRFRDAPKQRCADPDWTIQAARDALSRARASHPDCPEMNTTLATLLVDAEAARATWCQLGDSRIYLFRKGRARVLTHDHSVLQAMIDAGFVRPGRHSARDRNTLYAAVGSEDTPPTALCEAPLALQPGDVFLLCSDGFWELLDAAAMEEALSAAHMPEEWINGMLACIRQPLAHEMDNLSALAVWVGERIEVTRLLPGYDGDIGRVAWRRG